MGFGDLRSGPPPGIMLTDVLHPADPRAKGSGFDNSNAKELCRLFGKKALKVGFRDEAGHNPIA